MVQKLCENDVISQRSTWVDWLVAINEAFFALFCFAYEISSGSAM